MRVKHPVRYLAHSRPSVTVDNHHPHGRSLAGSQPQGEADACLLASLSSGVLSQGFPVDRMPAPMRSLGMRVLEVRLWKWGAGVTPARNM